MKTASAGSYTEAEYGEHADAAMEHYVIGSMVASTYADVAYCNAAVGALAPFFEGMFVHEFASLESHWSANAPTNSRHPRWQAKPDKFWKPSILFDDAKNTYSKNIHRGVLQLLQAVGMEQRLPPDFDKAIGALIGFRNAALHNGQEWPKARREAFKVRVTNEWDSTWFEYATAGGDVWIVYMTDKLIFRYLQLARAALLAFQQTRYDWGQARPFEGSVPAWLQGLPDSGANDAMRQFLRGDGDPAKM